MSELELDKANEFIGKLYFASGTAGKRALIGTDAMDYAAIFDLGLEGTEIKLTVTKVDFGAEYVQHVPTHSCLAGLYTINIDGCDSRFQLDVDAADAAELCNMGFVDGERVKLRIEKLPYTRPRKATYSNLRLDCSLMVPTRS